MPKKEREMTIVYIAEPTPMEYLNAWAINQCRDQRKEGSIVLRT